LFEKTIKTLLEVKIGKQIAVLDFCKDFSVKTIEMISQEGKDMVGQAQNLTP
jgi:hypothetical protein